MAATNSRGKSKERYQRLLRVLAYNTTEQQLPAARRHSIKHIMCMAGFEPDNVEKSIRVACERGDIWSLIGPDGVARLALMAEDDLQRVVEWIVEDEHPHQELHGEANRRLQEVRDDAE